MSGDQFINRSLILPFLVSMTFLASCTGTRKLTQDQYLYGGAEIHMTTDVEKRVKKDLKNKLTDLLRPNPNGRFLWMRPGLSIHNTIKEPKKEKGFRYWMKYKLGERPVYYDPRNTNELVNVFKNHLFHYGFFHSDVDHTLATVGKVKKVNILVNTGEPHLIDTLIFPKSDTRLAHAIHDQLSGSLLKKGKIYDLELLKTERERISNELKNQGYYYFEPDFLYFKADSSLSNHRVNLDLKVKPNIPLNATFPYSIKDVFVIDDYNLEYDAERDTLQIENYDYLTFSHQVRPEVVLDEVFLKEGQLYNGANHRKTIRYLMDLGIYRYANIQYPNKNDSLRTLDAHVYLTPQKKYSISAELNSVTKTNNFFGPGIRLNFLNRNLFRGSEILSTNLTARYEWQITNNEQTNTSTELSLESSLIFPRTIPFKQNKETKQYLGNTRATAGVGFFNRVNLYKFLTYNSSIKYSWIKRPRIAHEFLPIDINLTNMLETTDEFDDYLDQNPSVRRSLEEQFIFGLGYNFTYNVLRNRGFLYTGGFELAGNTLSLFNKMRGKEGDSDSPSMIFGVPFSQFVRFKNEVRYQFDITENTKIATRLIASVGIPYGNSDVLPYVRQFFVGGNNSVRAFRARSIGPGSYISRDTASFFLVDQSGDIKLEANIEYRFPIVKYLKGALFIDAGNVWLINEDPGRPGGVFEWDKFYRELAIGVGYGLRIDVDILVIRFDWAFPIRKPYLPENNRWNRIDFFDKSWRKDNMILNISIGYPF